MMPLLRGGSLTPGTVSLSAWDVCFSLGSVGLFFPSSSHELLYGLPLLVAYQWLVLRNHKVIR